MDQEITAVTRMAEVAIDFLVRYGLQILGALVVFFIGLKLAIWLGNRTTALAENKKIDVTLARLFGNAVKIGVLAAVVLITLGNFGISIAPLIALASASAFGATLAIQGPLSNYGAGLAIVVSRPFVVGDTIAVKGVSGVVQDITLAATVLRNQDGEEITVPNKSINGEVIVNSHGHHVVETKVHVALNADQERATKAVLAALAGFPELAGAPAPQIGIHEFTNTNLVLGIRFWVPNHDYFQVRYAANNAILNALREQEIMPKPA